MIRTGDETTSVAPRMRAGQAEVAPSCGPTERGRRPRYRPVRRKCRRVRVKAGGVVRIWLREARASHRATLPPRCSDAGSFVGLARSSVWALGCAAFALTGIEACSSSSASNSGLPSSGDDTQSNGDDASQTAGDDASTSGSSSGSGGSSGSSSGSGSSSKLDGRRRSQRSSVRPTVLGGDSKASCRTATAGPAPLPRASRRSR